MKKNIVPVVPILLVLIIVIGSYIVYDKILDRQYSTKTIERISNDIADDKNTIHTSEKLPLLGTWYYTPCTYPQSEDDFTKVKFIENNGKYYVEWEDEDIDDFAMAEEIVFISENIAQGTTKSEIRTNGVYDIVGTPIVDGMHIVNQYIFYDNDSFNLHPKIVETDKHMMMQPGTGYREPPEFSVKNTEDNKNIETVILSDYIGKTVGDVREFFGDKYTLAGYQASTVMFYNDIDVNFFVNIYGEYPTDEEKIDIIVSAGKFNVFDGLSGNMTYQEIANCVGSEVQLEEPSYDFDYESDSWLYRLSFDYKGYSIEYIWNTDPYKNKSLSVYVTK